MTLWTLAFVLPVTAGELEDAQAAIGTGDYVTALRLLGTLADQDNPYAERLLGIMYVKGLGVPQDYAVAMRWLRLAADKGLPDAQNEVGVLYRQGQGVERNEAEAVKWFRLAADQGGLVVAQNNLADSYVLGLGVAQDFGEAFKWYRIAADQSSSYAENVLGVAYEHGFNVAQDDAEAFRWYRRAANKIYDRPGNTWIHSPQYNIAAMYASGRGTAQDYVQRTHVVHFGHSVWRYKAAGAAGHQAGRYVEIHSVGTTRQAYGAYDERANRGGGKVGERVEAASHRDN